MKLKDRYVLEKRLGADALGVTYSALDLRQREVGLPDDHVSVKVLRNHVVENLGMLNIYQEEISRSRKLQCENIVAIFDYDRDGDHFFVVKELMTGEILADYLKREKRLSKPQALKVIHGICNALKVAHDRDILHTHLSPDAIFYTDDGVAKLFEFGIDEILPGEEARAMYTSPERRINHQYSKQDDIFAAAVIAYELLSGSHPFKGKPAYASTAPASRLWTMPGTWQALKDGLALDPGERAQTIDEFWKALPKN